MISVQTFHIRHNRHYPYKILTTDPIYLIILRASSIVLRTSSVVAPIALFLMAA